MLLKMSLKEEKKISRGIARAHHTFTQSKATASQFKLVYGLWWPGRESETHVEQRVLISIYFFIIVSCAILLSAWRRLQICKLSAIASW